MWRKVNSTQQEVALGTSLGDIVVVSLELKNGFLFNFRNYLQHIKSLHYNLECYILRLEKDPPCYFLPQPNEVRIPQKGKAKRTGGAPLGKRRLEELEESSSNEDASRRSKRSSSCQISTEDSSDDQSSDYLSKVVEGELHSDGNYYSPSRKFNHYDS